MTHAAAVRPHRPRRVPWRKRLPVLGLAVGLTAIVIAAVVNPGIPTPRVDVNDGGIWVTNRSLKLVGHLNYQSRTFDGSLRSASSEFDVAQHRDAVTFTDLSVNSVAPVDAAGMRLGVATSLAERAQAAQGGDRLGVLDAGEGNLWVMAADDPTASPMTDGTALASDLEGGVVAAGADGTVAAVAAQARRFVVVSPRGATSRITTTLIPNLPLTAELSITLVGARPVALDAVSNTLVLPDGSLKSLSDDGVATGGVLQQPGPDADHVLVATASELVSVPLDGGRASQVSAPGVGAGRPAAPVRLAGCEYAAWAGSGAYLRQCDDEDVPLAMTVDTLQAAQSALFRTNRDLIVLNDIDTGSVWLPNDNMVLADNWEPVDTRAEADDAGESPQTTDQIADPERSETNTPPVANDDDFGVRPGRAATLDVLFNDSDFDGDILTARPVTQPEFGEVAPSRGGQALSFDVPADGTGTTSFDYEAYDGQALAMATASVTVHPLSVNDAPRQLRDPGVKLGSNAEVTYNVLPDWRDPDGDPIFLARAQGPEGLQVQYHEAGTVTIRNLGHAPGTAVIDVTVSDGSEEGTGHLAVQVEPPGNLPPIANGDFAVTRVGEEALIQPLANDVDPNDDTLSLVRVSPAPQGTTATADLTLGTISFSARAAGSYYLSYSVTDGPAQAAGVIRVDVVDAAASQAVVAEDDLALLPTGGTALVAPLNNDTDPTGGVLVVQSVQVPQDSPLKVTLVDHHLLRIASQVAIDQPQTFTYTASNGTTQAVAEVLVVPTRALDTQQPLELQPDRAKVRVGDIASVPVLANDRSPAGLAMWVDSHLEFTADPEVGTPFVTSDQVRIEAGNQPGFLHVAYTVRDSAGNLGTSTVLFEVVAQDDANAAPRPKALTAWALSGQTTRIPVPLAGVDPDGDSVTLVGIEQLPQKGTASLGTDWLEYTPGRTQTGSDVFTYIVEDRQGKQATARVRVGIAPPSSVNQPPSAVPDTLLVRPDRSLAVPVLDNDLDPDDDVLRLDPDGVTAPDERLNASAKGTSVLVTSPHEPGSYVASYRVSDGRGGFDTGALTLNVSPDAPLLAPQARDDVVPAAAISDDGSAVLVDVLANDSDPDGDAAAMTVASSAKGVTVVGDRLSITPEQTRRLVVYSVTDQDGLVGWAVVSVPGMARTRPTLDATRLPVEVRAGEQISLDLRNYVVTRPDRTPHLNDPGSVKASLGSDGEPGVPDDHTIVFKSQPDFAGETAVSFEVSDGTAEDRAALTANLTIPIRVQASVNHPPVLTPTPVKVAAGDPPVVVDLTLMVSDPDTADPSQFSYSVLDAPPGVTVTPDGARITVQVDADHPKGPAGTIGIGVDDGSGMVTTAIPVTVTTSTRPLVQVSDAVVAAANAGGTEVIDIANYTINPFPGQPLRIQKTWAVSGEVASVTPDGTLLKIQLPNGFHGQVAIAYQVIDATGDQDRVVEGQVRLYVRDRPAAPSDVQVVATGAGSALVTFTPGPDNGAPITGFTLTNATTGTSYRCQVASCPVTGLTNGEKHAFSVVATNDVGDSPSSPVSAPVLVDLRPGRPNPPVCTAGDGSINVNWTPPVNQGSAIEGYTLYLSGAQSQQIAVAGDASSAVIDRLVNGEGYTVSVQARNRAVEASETSEPCAVAVPFGAPPGPVSVAQKYLPPDSPGLAKVEVSWVYPGSSNGRAWDQVRITTAAGERTISSDGSVTSAVVEVPAAEQSTLSVALHTEGGWSPERELSFQAVSVPLPIATPTVRATGRDGEIAITGASPVAGNGYRRSQLTVEYSTGGDWRELTDTTLEGFPNGVPVTFSFRQTADGLGSAAVGPSVTTPAVTPYGPPPTPTLTATSGDGAVTFAWTSGADNGGPAVTSIVLTVGGEQTSSASLTGSKTVAVAAGRTATGVVKACYADGSCGDSASATAGAWGTFSVQPRQCTGGEVPGLASGSTEQCHSFEVRPDNNWTPEVPLTCTFVSDVDSQRRTFRVSSYSSWTASGLRTNITDQKTLTGWIGSTLTCRPAS